MRLGLSSIRATRAVQWPSYDATDSCIKGKADLTYKMLQARDSQRSYRDQVENPKHRAAKEVTGP